MSETPSDKWIDPYAPPAPRPNFRNPHGYPRLAGPIHRRAAPPPAGADAAPGPAPADRLLFINFRLVKRYHPVSYDVVADRTTDWMPYLFGAYDTKAEAQRALNKVRREHRDLRIVGGK